MKYTIIDNTKLFYKEHNNTALIALKATGSQIYLNETSNLIYKLLKSHNDSNNIIHILKSMYPEVEDEVLRTDVKSVLHMLEIYNVLELEKEKVAQKNKDVIFVWEDTYFDTSAYLKLNYNKNIYNLIVTGNNNYFDVISLRLRSFNNQERFVIVRDKGKIITALSYIPVINGSTVCNINNVIFNEFLNFNDCCENLLLIINHINQNNKSNINKFRVNLVAGNEDKGNIHFIECIKKIGFSIESILYKEFGSNDLFMYTLNF